MDLPFDKIYCLHLAECQNREENMIKQFKKLGIEDKAQFWWTCKKNVSNKIGDFLTSIHTDGYDGLRKNNETIYGNVYNCALEHYNIIKTSYLRGFNSILIMEDDIEFIDDLNLIEWTFNNLPENYCCVKFYCTGVELGGAKQANTFTTDDPQEFSKKDFLGKPNSAVLYCLDRDGMKKYIDSFDKRIQCADYIFFDFLDDIYVTKQKLCSLYNVQSTINR